MTAFGVAARWLNLLCGLGLVGLFSASLLAGRSARPTAVAWSARTVAMARSLAVAALVSGIATLAYQVVVVSGRESALLDPVVWMRLLTESRFGTVWFARHGLLALLLALVVLREREESAADFVAWRLTACAIAAASVAAMAGASHAVAVEPLGGLSVFADGFHSVTAGLWLGALLPLALLLRVSSKEAGADARPYAVLAVRRFSALALGAMLALAATGLWNAWVEVGSVAGLVGTPYGGLLLVKLALLVPILALAAVNRRRLVPALAGDGVTVGRPAMTRLSRFMTVEALLAVLIVGAASGLSLSVPAVHDIPRWPFDFRLSFASLAGMPGARTRVLVGGQIAFIGALGAAIGLLERRRALLVGPGLLALVAGLWIALPPLVVDAYPTTYRRSPVPYQVGSIDQGMTSYREHCATCHGRNGRGDGPGGAGLPKLPADLTAPHTDQHTAGDLFWWITHGIPVSGMPAFDSVLPADDRWDVINFLRALSAGEQARQLTSSVSRDGLRVVAPDFTYAVGPMPPRSLKELRGRVVTLLVLFSLPASRARIDQLAAAYAQLELMRAEVIAVPIDADPKVIGRLGAPPFILFPVVTEGAAEIVPAYELFSRAGSAATAPGHVEFLIDRQGYMRARWSPGSGQGWDSVGALFAQVRALNEERPAAAPDEHVH